MTQSRFVYTDADMAGIAITRKGMTKTLATSSEQEIIDLALKLVKESEVNPST